jgi:hypothetical protein
MSLAEPLPGRELAAFQLGVNGRCSRAAGNVIALTEVVSFNCAGHAFHAAEHDCHNCRVNLIGR